MGYRIDPSVDNRLAAIEGHIRGIRRMIREQKGCEDIILQLSAVEGSVNKLAKQLLKNHLNNCVKESIEKGEADILERFNTVLDKYI